MERVKAERGESLFSRTQTQATSAPILPRLEDDPVMGSEIELTFTEDLQLTEVMRLRVQSLQQKGQKRQDGERLLLPHESVYKLDFSQQDLTFSRWNVSLQGTGRFTVTGICQLWTPDLTNLMTRQLLEPIGQFWRNAGDPDDLPIKCLEADIQEFGERIAELAKVRKVMYFLFAFKEGATKEKISCSLTFTKNN
ncbi:olfactory marker protein a [Carassius auratus]|uniref:Olfactory marker protein a n=1 Tax=Carassius auratus TaxID=7957 RepID=A0A6P6LS46_CARAU|nr:olfactory marker protein-like [Carassius auratus]XP_052387803.1 olfactory marker protein a [Carassius gibelio]